MIGTLAAPGMWPERRPARGSGASPAKRSAGRASAIWIERPATILRTSSSVATASRSSLARNVAGWDRAGPSSIGRVASRQAGKPPSRMRTSLAPKVRNIHHTRGAAKRPIPS